MSWVNVAYTHDSNRAYFKEVEHNIYRAEFPWTIRNALLKFDTSIGPKTTRIEFDKAFRRYVDSSFVAYDLEGNKVKLLSVKKDTSTFRKHNHSVVYFFEFEDGDIGKIKNTLMFNINDDQDNVFEDRISHHQVLNIVHVNKEDPFFFTPLGLNNSVFDKWFILGTMVVITVSVIGYEKWREKRNNIFTF